MPQRKNIKLTDQKHLYFQLSISFKDRGFGKGTSLPLGNQSASPCFRGIKLHCGIQPLVKVKTRRKHWPKSPSKGMDRRYCCTSFRLQKIYLHIYSEQWDQQEHNVHYINTSFILAPLTCLTTVGDENAPEVYLIHCLVFSQWDCF